MYNVLRKNNSGVYLKMIENKGDIVIYKTQDGLTKINVKFEDETVWLTQAQLVELYQTSKSNISEHIKHIFEEQELDEKSVVRNFRTTASCSSSLSANMFVRCSLIFDLLD